MTRSVWSMAACLAFGAGGMFLASNFRLRVEPVADPVAVAAPPAAEPAPLPDALTNPGRPGVVDGAVQPASGIGAAVPGLQAAPPAAATAAATAVLPPAPTDPLQVVQVGDESPFTWRPDPTSPVYLVGSTPKIKLSRNLKGNEELTVTVNNTALVKGTGFDYTSNALTSTGVTLSGAPGLADAKGRLEVVIGVKFTTTQTVRLELRLPSPVPAQGLRADQFSDSPLLDVGPTTGTLKFYTGAAGGAYLRLQGDSRAGVKVEVVTQYAGVDATVADTRKAPLLDPTTGRWDYELNLLTPPPNTTVNVTVRAKLGDAHGYLTTPLAFTTATVPPPIAAPTLGVPTATGKAVVLADDVPAGPAKVYRTNARALATVPVTVPPGATAVVLYADDVRVQTVTATGNFTAVPLGVGEAHALRAVAVAGPVQSPETLIEVRVREKGPAVDGVYAPGFGSNGKTEKVVIRFSNRSQLNPAHANDKAKYEVTGGSTAPTVTSAVYDPVADAVTLTVTGPFEYAAYKVGIKSKANNAAVEFLDRFGNALVAAADAPTDYFFQTTLFAQTLDQVGSPTAGVPLQTGPPVTFPEYTRFRRVPDGFNPSDRVETRVARLYYYRDAHRVAMIVNRSVKSYAAADVDVRRRAADRARTDADTATDERKRLEGQAVKAAQDARGAENQLQELQQKQATAKVEAANARVLLPQREFELQQATQALGRGTALTGDLAATDERVSLRRDALDQANSNLALATARADQAKTLPPGDPNRVSLDREQVRAQLVRDDAKAAFDRAVTEARLRADAGVDPNRAAVARLTTEVATLRQVVASADASAAAAANEIAQVQQRVTALRETEFQRTVAWQEQELRERRARETEFRRDVAAATADPNTYAPGNPESDDPVMQVSVSVIGEGLIQLRGPIKGLNVIRIMINQIDAPVGQVRVAMHTVQVNGERGDRMEKVVANIQRYLDHSRFLTTQSAQMLRRAVGVVASRKAEEAALTLAPGCTQADRDQRYLYAFFGKEFTDELALLDSEFLKTGNKLLSLHSMDTTSLASALFVLSLARNDVRLEIMDEFNRLLQTELPEMENSYYLAGLSGLGHKCDACCDRRVYMLSQNARFVSFGGFFNAQGAAADTMTPLQREFVRLAQVFKARMVTEIQLKQRVTERAMVEERFAIPYEEQRKQAIAAEVEAKQKLALFQDKLQDATAAAAGALTSVLTEIDGVDASIAETDEIVRALQALQQKSWAEREARGAAPAPKGGDTNTQVRVASGVRTLPKVNPENQEIDLKSDEHGRQLAGDLENLKELVELFFYPERFYDDLVKPLRGKIASVLDKGKMTWEDTKEIVRLTRPVLEKIRSEAVAARGKVQIILNHLQGREPEPSKAASEFAAFRADITEKLKRGRRLETRAQVIFAQVAPQFNQLVAVSANYEAALRKAQTARRPLDEKKLLDLLVDELEDKFIEQLEGTRAHTANIDNYIKALSTALDDDFQTQFYNPSFRRVREAAARFWDVTLGQIETTTVLANNRGLALVRPSATFEFDLPKRDIMITEGFKSAKALVDDYGALVNDPSFLALAKLYSGNPVTAQQNTGGSMSSVRSVLPGLPVTADEMVMAQAGPGRREFGSALEGLIPDPAIYKFETGTGFELRPTLSPDGQNVVFKLDYMYTTDVREPVRADEKHLGRVKRHFVSTDVQLSNYELREVSTYRVALRASRTGKGVPGLQDIPGVGVLFRPLPSSESSLQQNLIYSQATIFPTLFDLMGLRYAPAVADLDPLADRLSEFAARNRQLDIMQRTADIGATRVDEALRTPPGERRTDLYRPQVTLPSVHPNRYVGPGLRLRDGTLVEGPPVPPGYDPRFAQPQTPFAPGTTPESATRPLLLQPTGPVGFTPPGATGVPGVVPPGPGLPLPQDSLRTPARPPLAGATTGTAPPAGAGLGTVITPGVRPALPGTPGAVPPARPPLAGATTGTAPPAGAGLGTVITPGVRPALPGTPGAVPPPFPASAGLPAPAPLPPTGFPTSLPNLPPAPGGATGFPLPR